MKKIDTHHHIIPDIYRKNLASGGKVLSALKIPFPEWTAENMFSIMDANLIETAIVSPPEPGPLYQSENYYISLARGFNNFSADLIGKYPGRVGAFGMLPLPYIQASLKEIERCIDDLKLDGIILFSNYSEGYLGAEIYKPIFEELNRRRIVTFIHPTVPLGEIPNYGSLPPAAVEFVFDTARTILSLLTSGRLSESPNIKFLLAHAGGVLPYLESRLTYLSLPRPDGKDLFGFSNAKGGVIACLKELYFDVTLSLRPATLNSLLAFVSPDQITFGTDYPMVPVPWVSKENEDLENAFKDKVDIKEKIAFMTAEGLFPRFSKRAL
jgi:predicted TIM-barrel fold metal-dependent hydrolase